MKIYVLLVLWFITTIVANANLVLDNQAYKTNKSKLITKFSYHNTYRISPTQNYTLLDIGNGKSLPIATRLTEIATNNDTLLASIGMDYGVNDRFGIGMSLDGLHHTTRSEVAGTQSDKRFNNLSLNSQYQLTDNILIYGDTTAYDTGLGLRSKAFSDFVIGINAHNINDPIVLSGQLSYQYRTPRKTDIGSTINFGDSISLGGTVGFSVNPEITLTTGVNWSYNFANHTNDKPIGIDTTQTNLSLGLAYALTARTNLTTSIRTNISGQGGSTIILSFNKKLGNLTPSLSDKYKQINNLPNPADNTPLSSVSTQ